METGTVIPTASMEEAGRKWLVTFADGSAEVRHSTQMRTLALLLGSTPETACSTRWLYEGYATALANRVRRLFHAVAV
jgi:hypothetical protein